MKHLYGLFSLLFSTFILFSLPTNNISAQALEVASFTTGTTSDCRPTAGTRNVTFITINFTGGLCDSNGDGSIDLSISPSGAGVTFQTDPIIVNGDCSEVVTLVVSNTATVGDYSISACIEDDDGLTDPNSLGTGFTGCNGVNSEVFVLGTFTLTAGPDVQTFNNITILPGATGATIVNTNNAMEGVTDFGFDIDGDMVDDITMTDPNDGASSAATLGVLGGENDVRVTLTVNYPSSSVAAMTVSVENLTSATHGHQGATATSTMRLTATDDCGNTDNSTATLTALPVDLKYFRGTVNGADISLEWVTASEFNNNYFEIERSFDGLNYHPVAKIYGAGDSFEEISYNFIDRDVKGGNSVYYRLKQIDFDGFFNYSETINLVINNNGIFDVKNVYNDSESLQINYTSPNEKQVTATIYDLNGRILIEYTFFPYQELNSETIDISTLNRGFYIVNLHNGQNQVTKKFVKN